MTKWISDKEGELLELLKERFPDSSKATLRSWIEHYRVHVDGKPKKLARSPIKKGQQLEVLPKAQVLEGGLEILYSDRHLVAIDKPEGILSVATPQNATYHAHAILKRHFHPGRVFVVHRLDRETSGVMLFARTEQALWALKQELADHTMGREYYAIVEGTLQERSGTWSSRLIEGKDLKMRPTQREGEGELAVTHYHVIEQHRLGALLHLRLETGKKNQIRVHCQMAGHPIVGDDKYGSYLDPCGRLALHAHRLTLVHPVAKKQMRIESSLPESFEAILKSLR
jgi:tRNA pseudouridine32 synthase/23S rRNA pseudouridine746 synthase/23S rRNA pseudouridine1911/1915/1917 synthase